jgi:hypothetical protein
LLLSEFTTRQAPQTVSRFATKYPTAFSGALCFGYSAKKVNQNDSQKVSTINAVSNISVASDFTTHLSF